jgi:hypothetical protein
MGLLAISGWLVAAALAVGISWSAINVVRDSVSAGPAVASALPTPDEGGPTTAPSTSPTSSSPTPAPTVGALATGSGQGGTVQARCRAGRPDIVSIVPRQGFQADPDDSGDEVQFRSSDHRTEMKVSCSGLRATVRVEEHSSGGGGGDDGGNSGRGGGDDD